MKLAILFVVVALSRASCDADRQKMVVQNFAEEQLTEFCSKINLPIDSAAITEVVDAAESYPAPGFPTDFIDAIVVHGHSNQLTWAQQLLLLQFCLQTPF